MEQTRGSFREEIVQPIKVYKKGSFITSIVFLSFALIKLICFCSIALSLVHSGAISWDMPILAILSTLGIVVYAWITNIFVCITSFIGFCFGNASRHFLPTKKMAIAANIITFTNLGLTLLTAIPTLLTIIFG